MKKIEFGFANDIEPKGSWEGIGIKPGFMLTEADFYGFIEYNGNNYMIAKVTKDDYNRYPHLVDQFIARESIADLYPDGSGIIFLDQEESMITKQLESYLNAPIIKEKITGFDDIIKLCSGVNRANLAFSFLTVDNSFITTSITHETFERKKSALKSCHNSFSQLQEKMMMSNNYGR